MKTALLILAAVGVLQWFVFALLAVMTRETFPKRGLRRADRFLLISSAVLAAAWLAQVDYRSLWKGDPAANTASVAATSRSSCASIDTNMTVTDVKKRLGEPQRTRPDEETRGPGAVTLYYADARCTVHVFDDKVEFVD